MGWWVWLWAALVAAWALWASLDDYAALAAVAIAFGAPIAMGIVRGLEVW
jgi:hypothetical protein